MTSVWRATRSGDQQVCARLVAYAIDFLSGTFSRKQRPTKVDILSADETKSRRVRATPSRTPRRTIDTHACVCSATNVVYTCARRRDRDDDDDVQKCVIQQRFGKNLVAPDTHEKTALSSASRFSVDIVSFQMEIRV